METIKGDVAKQVEAARVQLGLQFKITREGGVLVLNDAQDYPSLFPKTDFLPDGRVARIYCPVEEQKTIVSNQSIRVQYVRIPSNWPDWASFSELTKLQTWLLIRGGEDDEVPQSMWQVTSVGVYSHLKSPPPESVPLTLKKVILTGLDGKKCEFFSNNPWSIFAIVVGLNQQPHVPTAAELNPPGVI